MTSSSPQRQGGWILGLCAWAVYRKWDTVDLGGKCELEGWCTHIRCSGDTVGYCMIKQGMPFVEWLSGRVGNSIQAPDASLLSHKLHRHVCQRACCPLPKHTLYGSYNRLVSILLLSYHPFHSEGQKSGGGS